MKMQIKKKALIFLTVVSVSVIGVEAKTSNGKKILFHFNPPKFSIRPPQKPLQSA
jgi:hypothetical protein